MLFNSYEGSYKGSYEGFDTEREEIIDTYKHLYDTNINLIKNNLNYYRNLYNDYENMYDYFLQIQEENKILNNQIKNTNNEIVTNDRKAYYEDQGINQLQFFYSVFYYIYIVILIFSGVFFIMKLSSFTNSEKITNLIMFILLFAYPFVSTTIMGFLAYLFNSFIHIFPANAYKKL